MLNWNLTTRRRMGVLVWVLGAVLAIVWAGGRTQIREGRGVGYAAHVEISASEAGRLTELRVELHQQVLSSDVIARLDPTPLQFQREVLAAELLAIEDEESSRVAGEARRFAQGLEDIALDRARLRVGLEEDRVRLIGVAQLLETERGLLSTGASSQLKVDDLDREASALTARIGAQSNALSVAEAALSAARGRALSAPTTNDWTLVAATRRLEALDGELARLELTAGIDGQVTWIYKQAGEVVAAGDPVVRVSRIDTSEVLAWISAGTITGLNPGTDATVIRASGELLHGSVLSVGASPIELPAVLWKNPAAKEWGVPVRIQLAEGRVAPDEPVQVRI
jgi:multidrug resistance efflux pump